MDSVGGRVLAIECLSMAEMARPDIISCWRSSDSDFGAERRRSTVCRQLGRLVWGVRVSVPLNHHSVGIVRSRVTDIDKRLRLLAIMTDE
jgi:hypothetical protein